MKKFLQKSSAWLVMLVAWFAVSMTAMAQDVTWDFSTDSHFTRIPETKDGLTVNVAYLDGAANLYSNDLTVGESHYGWLQISSENTITKIVFHEIPGWQGMATLVCSDGSFTSMSNSVSTWEGSANEIVFSSTSDVYCSYIEVWFGAVDETNYTLEFVDAPSGASVTIDGKEYTANDSWTVAKNLNANSVKNIVEPEGYYAEVNYDASNHKFTVTYKHWYIYNIVTNNANGATGISDWKYNGDQIKSKTAIPSSNFEAKEVNGFNGEVSVDKVDDYTYTVTVTYTQKDDVTYYIVFPEGTPAGTKVTVKNDQEFTASGTYLTPYDLTYNDFAVAVPEGYWSANTWNCYVAASRTFTVEVHEYLHYNVVVEGTDDANAGVVYNYTTYYAGAVINSQYEISLSSVKAANVAGLEGTVTLEGTTFKVTYTKPEYIVIDTTTGKIGNSYWTLEGSGVTVQGSGTPLNIWYYAWGANWTATVKSNTFAIEKIEFIDRDGDTMFCDVNCGSFSNNIWTCDGGEYYSVTFDPNGGGYYNDGDYYISSVRVWLKQSDPVEPTPAPEFPVEGVAYEIKNIGLGKYINISSAETDAATVSDESEGLYFTWDEMKAAFTIQDADGNYLGKTTNDWTTSATTPEYWIVETVSDGVYAFKSVSSKYLAPNKNDGSDNRLMRDKDSNFYYTFTIAPFVVIPDAELTVTDAEWTTFCSHTNVMLPADYTAYIVTGTQENGQLELKALEGSFESKGVDYDFANNMVSMDGDNFVVEGAPDALTATFHTDGWAGGIQGGFLFGMSADGDYVEISVPEDYEGNITYVEVEPYPGQSVTWKFDNGNFGSTARYTVNGKSVKVTIGGSYYYYIQHIRVGVEGLAAPVIPSYAGVLVNGPAGTNIPYTKKPGATPSDVTGNLLVGCNESATWNETGKTYYKFSLDAENTAGSAGFYWGVDGGASIEAHAGKAYLVLDTPAASNSRYLINGFGDETLTGLDSVIAPEAAEAIFNLQGQRVNAAKGGVYVKGGKKFIVK